jgi:phosphohistidine phosphatase
VKELCLVRHAKSSWKYPKLDDFERPLNKRGRKNAPLMGKIILRLGLIPDLIIASPASRAAMTARVFALEINYPLDKIRYLASIYESDEMDLVHIIKKLENKLTKVMLVGHNPGITDLANRIGNYPVSNIPTSGVFGLALDITSWSEIMKRAGKVKYFEYPKKYT